MKVKPYRRCDICNDDYLKVKNCMKIKQYSVPLDPCGFSRFENVDVCPICAKKMIKWIRKQRWESEEEQQRQIWEDIKSGKGISKEVDE